MNIRISPSIALISLILLGISPSCHGSGPILLSPDSGDSDTDDDSTTQYLVLVDGTEGSQWYEAGRRLADFRDGLVFAVNLDNLNTVRTLIEDRQPELVAVVLPRERLDINLAHSMLMLGAELDDDPFVDIGLGYITGATASEAMELVDRIIEIDSRPIEPELNYIAAIGGSDSFTVDAANAFHFADGLGLSGTVLYPAVEDPDVGTFLDNSLDSLSGAGILMFTGNADPRLLWVFEEQNLWDDSRYLWPYDAARVGDDPGGLIRGVWADDIRSLDLDGTVVFAGAPFTASVGPVVVASGLGPTFGDVEGTVRIYHLGDDESLASAFFDAGAVAVFGSLGVTHGFRADIELEAWLEMNAPLGAVAKSMANDLVMSFRGEAFDLPLYSEGSPFPDVSEASPLAIVASSRILLGDPGLQLTVPELSPPTPATLTEINSSTYRILVIVEDPQSSWMISTFHWEPGGLFYGRIYPTVTLPPGISDVSELRLVRAEYDGQDLGLSEEAVFWQVERNGDQTVLHIQIETVQESFHRQGLEFEFEIIVEREVGP